MIFKSYEISKLNLNENNSFFHGKNEGLKNQIKINLLEKKKLLKYEEVEVINKPENFLKV